MERKDIIQVLSTLKTAYPAFYSKMTKSELEKVVDLWHVMFRDEDSFVLVAAVHELIGTHKGYPPDIATVKEQIRNVTAAALGEPTDHELWLIYRGAVSNCLYNERAVFESLPPILQRYAGSPGMLTEHAMMESERFNSVIGSTFLKTIPQLRKREEYRQRLPEGVREYVAKLSNKFDMPDEDAPLSLSEENDRRNAVLNAIESYGVGND